MQTLQMKPKSQRITTCQYDGKGEILTSCCLHFYSLVLSDLIATETTSSEWPEVCLLALDDHS